jgi:hypothetical protein
MALRFLSGSELKTDATIGVSFERVKAGLAAGDRLPGCQASFRLDGNRGGRLGYPTDYLREQ